MFLHRKITNTYISLFKMILILWIYYLALLAFSNSEYSKIKIVAPEIICANEEKTGSDNFTDIWILGADDKNSTFSWDICGEFKQNSREVSDHDRWKLLLQMYELQESLQKQDVIGQGKVSFNNSWLIPDIKYIFNLTIHSGANTETKWFTIDYINDTGNSEVTPKASVLLIGPDYVYRHSQYIVKTKVTICGKIDKYFIHWEVKDSSDNTIILDNSGSRVLNVFPNTFPKNGEFTVICTLRDVLNLTLAVKNCTVEVRRRKPLLKIGAKQIVVGKNVPFRISADYFDFEKNNTNVSFEWDCETQCGEIINNTLEISFPHGIKNNGSYIVTVTATQNDTVINETSEIIIINTFNTPSTYVKSYVQMEMFDPLDTLQIETQVDYLQPGCRLQWKSINEDSCTYINLENVPGNPGTVLNVYSANHNFLNELLDHLPEVFEKKFHLYVHPANGAWPGLQLNKCYIFRLTVTCNINIYLNESRNVNIETSTADYNLSEIENIKQRAAKIEANDDYSYIKTFTVYSDIMIKTISRPEINQLTIDPEEGEALKTMFRFSTSPAKDNPMYYPLLYYFGYKTDKTEVVLKSQYDISTAVTMLPYSDASLICFIKVCNSINICNTTQVDNVTVTLPKYSVREHLNLFKELINEYVYAEAFTLAKLLVTIYENDLYSFNATVSDINEILISEAQRIERSSKYNLKRLFIHEIESSNQLLYLNEEILKVVESMKNHV